MFYANFLIKYDIYFNVNFIISLFISFLLFYESYFINLICILIKYTFFNLIRIKTKCASSNGKREEPIEEGSDSISQVE